jgi:hypothetical protein
MIAIRPFSMIICSEECEFWRRSALSEDFADQAGCIGRGLKKPPLFWLANQLSENSALNSVHLCDNNVFESSGDSTPKKSSLVGTIR